MKEKERTWEKLKDCSKCPWFKEYQRDPEKAQTMCPNCGFRFTARSIQHERSE